jgi:16S rRNA (uracil1498-N3)-methyltransferase
MIRLYLRQDLEAGMTVEPSPEQARYLMGVMRRGVGDELLLFNGRDGEWRARIAAVSKRGCALALVEQERPQAAGPDLELIMALVKRGPLEWVVEKAVELGALRIRLTTTKYTNSERANVDRLHSISIESAEQTGRLDVPEIVAPTPLGGLLESWDHRRSILFCDEGGKAPPMLDAVSAIAGGTSGILIGPEGGFAPEERSRLRSLPYVVPVSLGPRILRADTAAISALTLWQAGAGDWRGGLPVLT